MSDAFWHFPGPRRFLDGVVSDAFSGSCSVILAPTHLLSEVTRQVRFELRNREHRVDTVESESSPTEGILECLGEGDSHLPLHERIVRSGFRAFLVNTDDRGNQDGWLSFVRSYHHHALRHDAQNRATIIVVTSCVQGVQRDDVALKHRLWKNVWGETDSLALAESNRTSAIRQSTIERIIVHTIARLAIWDGYLAELLSLKGAGVLDDPISVLVGDARARLWTRATPEDENLGTVGFQNGDRMVHSSLLAARLLGSVLLGGDELHRRRWQGQAVVLLPWIEEQRQKLTKTVSRFFKSEPDRTLLLEVGQLWFELRPTNAPAADKKRAFVLREARNKLAHGNLLSLRELSELVEAFGK